MLYFQDLNHDPANPNTRLYATHEAQPYHNDASDIVGEWPACEAHLLPCVNHANLCMGIAHCAVFCCSNTMHQW